MRYDVTSEQWRTQFLPYDPGPLPTRPEPQPGEEIVLHVEGLPPGKVPGQSLRNPGNPRYQRFRRLRSIAIEAMDGRAWYHGPVGLDVELWVTELEKGRTLLEYIGGIMDTLDGGHGVHFTYLPVVYEDDAQVEFGDSRIHRGADRDHYWVRARFV